MYITDQMVIKIGGKQSEEDWARREDGECALQAAEALQTCHSKLNMWLKL